MVSFRHPLASSVGIPRALLCLVLLYSFSAATLAQSDEGEFLQLKTILDESRGHCLDIAGAGANIDLNVPLQAHTCKRHFQNRGDNLFVMEERTEGKIYNPDSDVCMDAVDNIALGTLFVRECTDSPTQLFTLTDDGELRTAGDGTEYCVTAAPTRSYPAVRLGREPEFGVTNVARLVLLLACEDVDNSLKQWAFMP